MLRAMPPVDECIRAAEAHPALAGLARAYLKALVTRAQTAMRAAIGNGKLQAANREDIINKIVGEVEHAAAIDEPAQDERSCAGSCCAASFCA